MKKFTFILLIFAANISFAQNPIYKTITYLTGNCLTPDTTYYTFGVRGSSSFFSSKVTQTLLTPTIVVHQYKPPVVTPPPPPVNKPPVVTLSITSFTSTSVTFSAIATDPEGSPLTYQWQKVSGGVATINSPTGVSTLISGLSGDYNFSCTVKDNAGGSTTINISYTAAGPTPPPPTPTGSRANLIFESTFEKVTDWTPFNLPVDKGTAWTNAQTCCALNSLNSAPIARTGNKAAMFTLHKSDPLVSGSLRSEITGPEESTFGTTRWYAFSIYLPAGFTPDNTALLVAQWHSSSFNTVPPMKLILENSGWSIVNTSTGNGNSVGDSYHGIGSYSTGVWTDFVIRIMWSNTSGQLQVWKNGTSVFSSSNIKTSYTGGTYFKTGIYGYGWGAGQGSANPPPYVVYIDDWREGNENAVYSDVAP